MLNLQQLESKNTMEVTEEIINQTQDIDFENIENNKIKLDINFFILEGIQKSINYDSSINYIYFKINDETKICRLEFYFYDNNKLAYLGSNVFSLITQKTSIKCDKRMLKKIGVLQLNKALKVYSGEFLHVFRYFTYILDNRKTIVKNIKRENINSNKITEKNNSNNVTSIENNRHIINIKHNKIEYKLILDDIAQKELFKRTYIRHTESWSVRGYTRHLKSGKTIYIKPSIRGNKKKDIKSKVYIVK